MSAIMNILEGVKQQAEDREKTLAEVQAEIKNEASGTPTGGTPEEFQELTPAEMNQAIQVLSKAVMDLTAKLEGKGE